jgi:Abnormal spindle-like microcephaly-assoc'd, ASPM-SPD-2-Hydin/FG-GAP repeat
VDYPVGLSPNGLAAADLNGDGGPDLAVANSESGTVSLLLNLPVIGIFPNTLTFGNQKVGVKSNPLTVTIGNPSGTPITIKKPAIIGADAKDFAATTTCPLSPAKLSPGANCSVLVTFTPKATGSRTATLKISDSVPGSPQLVTVAGAGQ